MRGFHLHVSVPPFPYHPLPLQKYVRITLIRKNSVAYVKNNVLRFRKFAIAINPFTYDRVLFFHICRSYWPAATLTLLRTKLGALFLRPAFWACRAITAHRPQHQRHERLVRTRFLRKRYGNGFMARDTECWKSGITL